MNSPDIKRLERLAAILLSVTVLVLVIIRAEHAKALWRDECGLLQLSQMPAIGDIVRNFPHEAFPPFFPVVIRVWTAVFGASDAALRGFGALIGGLFVGAVWFSCRALPGGFPLLSLGLVGLNGTFLTWGTSIRGYGLACVMIVLAVGLAARLLVKPHPLLLAATGLAFLGSLHCLLHNAVLLLAIAGCAFAVCLARRNFKRGIAFLLLAFFALISFLPYVGAYSTAREWDMVVRISVPLNWLWHQLNFALNTPWTIVNWIWYGCLAFLIIASAGYLWVHRRDRRNPQWDLLLFCLLLLGASLIGYYVLLRIVGYFPQPWYFLALMAVVSVVLDLLAGTLSDSTTVRLARLSLAFIFLAGLPFANWSKITERQTNMDLVANALERKAGPGDLIVVSPWQFGISFNWYYRGTTPWVTLPQLADHRLHRYDLLKDKMTSPDAIADLRDLIRDTLRSGNRVWFVGEVRTPRDGERALALSPAPDAIHGWDNLAYVKFWMEQLAIYLRSHVVAATWISLPATENINGVENVPLAVSQGWRD